MSSAKLVIIEQGTQTYRYTNARKSRTVGGNVYTPVDFSHGEWRRTLEADGGEITFPHDTAPLSQYIASLSLVSPLITVMEMDQSVIMFGEMLNVSFDGSQENRTVKVKISSGKARGQAELPRRRFCTMCSHYLGDGLCGVNLTSFQTVLAATAVTWAENNTKATHADFGALGDDYFLEGFASLGNERAGISKHVGNDVWLMEPFTDVSSGNVTFTAGCLHIHSECVSKFDNLVQFGGFFHAPRRNPHTEGF